MSSKPVVYLLNARKSKISCIFPPALGDSAAQCQHTGRSIQADAGCRACGELGYECQGRLMPPLYFLAYVAIFGLICYNRYADYFTQR